jgi:hypothetical protein
MLSVAPSRGDTHACSTSDITPPGGSDVEVLSEPTWRQQVRLLLSLTFCQVPKVGHHSWTEISDVARTASVLSRHPAHYSSLSFIIGTTPTELLSTRVCTSGCKHTAPNSIWPLSALTTSPPKIDKVRTVSFLTERPHACIKLGEYSQDLSFLPEDMVTSGESQTLWIKTLRNCAGRGGGPTARDSLRRAADGIFIRTSIPKIILMMVWRLM